MSKESFRASLCSDQPAQKWSGQGERGGEGEGEGGRGRGRERERERERGERERERERGEGALMFELRTSYVSASWWVVDPRMARIGEHGMAPGISVQ